MSKLALIALALFITVIAMLIGLLLFILFIAISSIIGHLASIIFVSVGVVATVFVYHELKKRL